MRDPGSFIRRQARVAAALLCLGLAAQFAHAETSEGEQEGVALQKARAGRVKARGEKVHYTKKFDLSGLASYKPAQKVSGTIRIWGLNYLTDGQLGKYWEAGFRKYHPDVKIEYFTPTALVAIPGLYIGEADLGASRHIAFDDLLAFQRVKGYHPTEIEMVTGSYDVPGWAPALGIFVNAKNPLAKLTLEQLDGIFGAERDGGWDGVTWNADAKRGPEKNIRTWGQLGLGGEWADKEIHPFGRPMKYHQQLRLERGAFQGGDKWNEKLREFAHDAKPGGGQKVSTTEMLLELGKDPYAIAFSDLGAATPDVKLLAIARKAGDPYVAVSLESVQSRAYPLVSQSYLYLDRKPGTPVDPKVHEFLHYILSREGQAEVMRDAKFLPLTPEIAKAQLAKID